MSSDFSSFLKTTADTQQAVAGINADKALKFQVGTGFSWRDPPISPLGYVFPSDSTYHPLLNSSNYEIATNLFSVEGSGLPESEKNLYKKKIKDIVESAHAVKVWGNIYLAFIIIVTAILMMVLFAYVGWESARILSNIMLICGILFLGAVSFGLIGASGLGINDWYRFESVYNAAQSSGSTPQRILEQMKMDDRSEQDMHMKYQMANMPNNSSLAGSTLAGIAIGSLLNFGKK